jgi:hypothetical protein
MRLSLVLGLIVLATGVLTPSSGADGTTVARFKTDGYAFAVFSEDCPDTAEPPPAGTVCRETTIELFREGVAIDGGSLAPPKTPWSVFMSQATLTFVDDEGNLEASDERVGFLPVVDPANVTYDREHLAFASLNADIPWDDGSIAHVDFHWEAIADREVYGNDGPALEDFGLVRKYVDKCTTRVNQGHQKTRISSMTGTLDGTPVHTYTAFPAGYISFNHFISIDTTHGPHCQ